MYALSLLCCSQSFILYFQKQNKDGSTLCRCSVRNKKTTCTATVIHIGDSFTTNNKPHTHESKPGILTNVLITKKIIETAKADIFTSLFSDRQRLHQHPHFT